MPELEPLAITKGNQENLFMVFDTKFEKPKVTISGIPITEQQVSWSFTPGVVPSSTVITVPNSIATQIDNLSNPVSLEIRVSGEIYKQRKSVDLRIENLYITEGRRQTPFHWQFELQDMRFLWRGAKLTIKANRTQKQNFFKEGQAGGVAAGDPALLQQPFTRYAAMHYLDWSINGSKPWTVLELLVDAMGQLPGPRVASFPAGINYLQENVTFEEEPAQTVLSTLCAWCRVNIGVSLDGRPYIYNIDDAPFEQRARFLPIDRPYLEGTSIFNEDKKRFRPKRVSVKFRNKQEVVVKAVSALSAYTSAPTSVPATTQITPEMIQDGRAVGCVNVIRLPQDIEINEVLYQRGVFVPMADFLFYHDLTDMDVRTRWFGTQLEMHHAFVQEAGKKNMGPRGEPDPQALMRVTAIRSCYRRLWMIDPFWKKKWESWEPTRCAMLDPITGYSPPSPVWQDLCIVPKIRPPSIKFIADKKLFAGGVRNWIIDEQDPNREKPHSAVSVSVIDHDLGVFETSLPPLVFDIIHEIIPCAVNPLPAASPERDIYLWGGCALHPNFNMETVISVVRAVDSDYKPTEKQYSVFVVNASEPAVGPDIEFLSQVEIARFPVMLGATGSALAAPNLNYEELTILVRNKYPINWGYLWAIARGEASKIFHSYKDRLSGIAVYPGIDISKLRLFGHCRDIEISFSPDGLRTIYNIAPVSPTPELFQRLPDPVMTYVYKQIPRSL